MGQSMNLLQTHTEVPEDVKLAIPPVQYTPASPSQRQTDREYCEDCGEYFGWFKSSTNCDWCGRQLCYRCCPNRHLLSDKPGCVECTRKAYQIRRTAMLHDHYAEAGFGAKKPSSGHSSSDLE